MADNPPNHHHDLRSRHRVRIITDDWLRVGDRDLETRHFHDYAASRPLLEELALTRSLLRALESYPDRQCTVAVTLYHHIREGNLGNHFGYGVDVPASVTPRDEELHTRVVSGYHRHRHRRARPRRLKYRLNRSETQGANNLQADLQRRIPRSRALPGLGSPHGQYMYNVHGRDLPPTITMRMTANQELEAAAKIDTALANDCLAFEEQTAEGDGSDLWKVVTRAQLLQQKGPALKKLPDRVFQNWNAEVARTFPYPSTPR